MSKINSYIDKNGQAYYRHTGRYTEVTKDAIPILKNNGVSAQTQKNLAPKGSVAARITRSVRKELNW